MIYPRSWKDRIKLKDLLNNDDSDKNAQQVGKAFAARIRKHPWSQRNGYVRGLADEFDDVRNVDDFNATINDLYDNADYDRVWID